jgi:ribulose-5-phosphate 4-epimerase/fuculose-1-phosphate aldolase
MLGDFTETIDDLIEICRLLYDRRLICSSGGNVSLRIDKKVYITPTGGTLWRLKPNDLVEIDFETGSVIGAGRPSKELGFHLGLLHANPNNKAVIHVHPTMTISFSCKFNKPGLNVVPSTNAGFYIRAGQIPMLPYFPSGSHDLHNRVNELAEDFNTILLGNHGIVVSRQTLLEAFNVTEEIEQNFHIYNLIGKKGRCLTEREKSDLDTKIGRHWPNFDKYSELFSKEFNI